MCYVLHSVPHNNTLFLASFPLYLCTCYHDNIDNRGKGFADVPTQSLFVKPSKKNYEKRGKNKDYRFGNRLYKRGADKRGNGTLYGHIFELPV